MKCTNNSVKVVGALLAGAIIGGALGILFAPEKGSDTRKRIADKSGDLTDSIKEKLAGFLEDIKEEVEGVTAKANGFIGRSKAVVEKM